MNRQLPYEISYKTLETMRTVENGFLWSTLVCSIMVQLLQWSYVQALMNVTSCVYICLTEVINYLSYFSIIGYAILYIIVEIFMQPMVSRKRRKGFIDNSLGTTLLDQPVINYYDNDDIPEGPYKMLVNCYENCFFTYNIIKEMLPRMIAKNFIFAVLLFSFAYFGIKDNIVAIPVLQLYLSSLFLFELFYHISFYFRLKHLCENFNMIFRGSKSTKNKTMQDAIHMVLEYETTLAYNKSPNSNKVYRKLNDQLTAEWEDIKTRLNIG